MRRFTNNSIIRLLYEIADWCVTNGKFPKRIDIWKDDMADMISANVYYCDEKKVKTNQNADELTKCERENANHLQKQENFGMFGNTKFPLMKKGKTICIEEKKIPPSIDELNKD